MNAIGGFRLNALRGHLMENSIMPKWLQHICDYNYLQLMYLK